MRVVNRSRFQSTSARARSADQVGEPAHLEDLAAAPLDLDPRGLRIGRENGFFADRAVGPARLDRELRAHGFFSTVRWPSVPFSAPARGVSWTSRTRINAFFEAWSFDAPMTRVWLSVTAIGAR